jgi:hypothetical protein
MLHMIEHVFVEQSLVAAFAVVGAVMWISLLMSKRLSAGRIHGSAIAIVIGLVLAYVGGAGLRAASPQPTRSWCRMAPSPRPSTPALAAWSGRPCSTWRFVPRSGDVSNVDDAVPTVRVRSQSLRADPLWGARGDDGEIPPLGNPIRLHHWGVKQSMTISAARLCEADIAVLHRRFGETWAPCGPRRR